MTACMLRGESLKLLLASVLEALELQDNAMTLMFFQPDMLVAYF